MSTFRKPTFKEKLRGCLIFLKEMLIGIIFLDLSRVRLFHIMFWQTAKGNFEVMEKSSNSQHSGNTNKEETYVKE